ncbi:hypothetical protein [Deinococcus ruber]|nr:hypothetical protein [Deinococcus ruber]
MTPKLIVVFYQEEQGAVHPYKIPISQDDAGGYVLGAPIQGTARDVQVMRSCLEGGMTLLHEHVLYAGLGVLMWWVPAGRAPLHFLSKIKEASSIEALNGRPVPQPPLLMLLQGRTLRVFALQENKRPTMTTRLYKAPYWNMFADGKMCTGTVKIPDVIDPQKPEDITRLFFQSNFSGASRQSISNYPASHQEMWQEADRRDSFDPAWLMEEPRITTIKELMTCTTPTR